MRQPIGHLTDTGRCGELSPALLVHSILGAPMRYAQPMYSSLCLFALVTACSSHLRSPRSRAQTAQTQVLA